MSAETAPLSAVRVEPVVRFKAYVVMAYYHQEGWNAVAECDTFQEAVKEREHWMGMGNSKVQIFKPVDMVVTESNAALTGERTEGK